MSALTRMADVLLARTPSNDMRIDRAMAWRRSEAMRYTSVSEAMRIPAVFQAATVISNAIAGLRMTAVTSSGDRLDSGDSRFPQLLRKPNPLTSMDIFVHQTVMSLLSHGNAYWRVIKFGGVVESIIPLNAASVTISEHANGIATEFMVGGVAYGTDEIKHLPLMLVAELGPYGLGPIQQGQSVLHGARMVQHYADNWFDDSAIANGWLTSDQKLTPDQAQTWKEAYKESQRNHDISVFGQGVSYKTNVLNPKDAQFVEIQEWYRSEIALLFGITPALLMTGVSGSGITYQNASTEWLQMMRFKLQRYYRVIEVALTELLPGKQKAEFNMEALLRGDSAARADYYKTMITAGVYTPDEAREIEGQAPLTDDEIARVKLIMEALHVKDTLTGADTSAAVPAAPDATPAAIEAAPAPTKANK